MSEKLHQLTVNVDGISRERSAGCEARLTDDGVNRTLPVCMGGTAIVGCIDADNCHGLYVERMNQPRTAFIRVTDGEDKIIGMRTVPRAPLVQPEG